MQSKLSCCGIDLGTTNSEIYTYEDGHPVALLPPTGARITPSRVGVDPGSTRGNIRYVTGNRLKNLANKKPENVIYEPKRLVGRAFSHQDVKRDRFYWPFELVEGEDEKPRYKVIVSDGDVKVSAVDIDAQILKLLASYRKGGVEKAVITVPSYFTKEQVDDTKMAGKLAGLDVIGCLPEPVAASIAYGHGREVENENVLVYDLGGGTFDCCIVAIENGRYHIKKSDGDPHLGGADFDNAIVRTLAGEIREKFNYDIHSNKKDLAKLKEAAEKAKIALSDADSYEIQFKTKDMAGSDIIYNHQLTRAEFNALIRPFVNKTINKIQSALNAIPITPQNIGRVLLVGGSTRIPYVQERLREFFNREIDDNVVNIDEAVAEGAAIYAHFKVEKDVDLCEGYNLEKEERDVDGEPLEGIPCTSYCYHIYGNNNMEELFRKGKEFISCGKAIEKCRTNRRISRSSKVSKAIIEIWVDDPMTNKKRIVDILSLDVSNLGGVAPRPGGGATANDIKLSFDMTNRGRLMVTMEDNITLESTTSTVMLRDVEVSEFYEVEKYYANRKMAERLMCEAMKKGNSENAVAVRKEIRTVLEDLTEGVEFIDFRDMQQLEKSLFGLKERLRNL